METQTVGTQGEDVAVTKKGEKGRHFAHKREEKHQAMQGKLGSPNA